MVSTGSFVTIGSITYPIPDTLTIDPAQIWDEKEDVYRIALGKPNMIFEDEAFYKPLFMCLDQVLLYSGGFISDIQFKVHDKVLLFKLAYIQRTKQPFGMFYDIEAAINEIQYKGNTIEQTKD